MVFIDFPSFLSTLRARSSELRRSLRMLKQVFNIRIARSRDLATPYTMIFAARNRKKSKCEGKFQFLPIPEHATAYFVQAATTAACNAILSNCFRKLVSYWPTAQCLLFTFVELVSPQTASHYLKSNVSETEIHPIRLQRKRGLKTVECRCVVC